MKLEFTTADIQDAVDHFRQRPQDMLLINELRRSFAGKRFEAARDINVTKDIDRVWPDAVELNLKGMNDFSGVERTNRLVRALSVIDRVHFGAANLRALSVGPRTEMELLALVAHGFKPDHVRGLDLISYSPWIDVGNMHAMPYHDASFDVIIAGWVLVYSSDPALACHEMLRVAANHGIIAIGATRWSEQKRLRDGNGRTRLHYPTADDVLEMFAPHVRNVYVRHDGDDVNEGRTLVIFEVSKG